MFIVPIVFLTSRQGQCASLGMYICEIFALAVNTEGLSWHSDCLQYDMPRSCLATCSALGLGLCERQIIFQNTASNWQISDKCALPEKQTDQWN